jgi:hypothetical protein
MLCTQQPTQVRRRLVGTTTRKVGVSMAAALLATTVWGVAGQAADRSPLRTAAITQAELTPAPARAYAEFGYAVAAAGSMAVVGAPSQQVDGHSQQGDAFVFNHTPTGWHQVAILTAADGASGDNFGLSVAATPTTIVVGALAHHSNDGAVYVFTGSGSTWRQTAELNGAAGKAGLFGWSVHISGGELAVGAPEQPAGPHDDKGAVYLFDQSGSSWKPQAELFASGEGADSLFGDDMALSKTTIAVGAEYGDSGEGAVYVFTGAGSTWRQTAELLPKDGGTCDGFGTSVAMSGSTLAVGSPSYRCAGDSMGAGAVYVFTGSGSSWAQTAQLTPADGAAYDEFGYSVRTATAGGTNTVLIGAPIHTVGSHTSQGAAYVFTGSGSNWKQASELTSDNGPAFGGFGAAVALAGTTAVVGAGSQQVGSHKLQGAAYAFSPM